jgi:hypothetical protein
VDAETAKALAILIDRVTLSNVKVWHSSDESRSGGVGAGQNWFDAIIEKIRNGKVIIALVTKEGGHKPWIYFESGFAAGQPEMTVIPVAVGLKDANEIPAPLSAYQSYALIDQRSVAKFLEKLLAIFDVKFDEEMSQKPMHSFVSEIARLQSVEQGRVASTERAHLAPSSQHFDPSLILSHIDRRLNDFVDAAKGLAIDSAYPVEFTMEFPKLKATISLSIGHDDTVQDILNAMWGILSEQVKAYTYMESWILEEENTGARLIIREIAGLIPARYVFRQDLHWTAKPLKHPYSPVGGGRRTAELQDEWYQR